MPLLTLIIYLAIIGLFLYLFNLLPIDGTIKRIVHIIVIVIVILWVLSIFIPALPQGPYIGLRRH